MNYTNSENLNSNYIFNISPIITKIFSYSSVSDLISCNTVCKKWNIITNPTIHRRIKLVRHKVANKVSGYKNALKLEPIEDEVKQLVLNNTKHSHLVREVEFNLKLKPQLAIEIFDLFKLLTRLNISDLEISQDQLLCIISRLSLLEDLILHKVAIKQIIKKKLITEAIKMSPALTRLELQEVRYIGNPQLFIQSLNSHTNIEEFRINSLNEVSLLAPFTEYYPSLRAFNCSDEYLIDRHTILTILSANPQIIKLKVKTSSRIDSFISFIEMNMINLEVLMLEYVQPLQYPSYYPLFKITRVNRIKNLTLLYNNLNEDSLSLILLNCPYLTELTLKLPLQWKFVPKLLRYYCYKLEKLTIIYNLVHREDFAEFFRIFYHEDLLPYSATLKKSLPCPSNMIYKLNLVFQKQ